MYFFFSFLLFLHVVLNLVVLSFLDFRGGVGVIYEHTLSLRPSNIVILMDPLKRPQQKNRN
jgi:hypothetical protein